VAALFPRAPSMITKYGCRTRQPPGSRILRGGRPSLVFGLVVTATDGTVFDLAATEAIQARFATPTGGRFPRPAPSR